MLLSGAHFWLKFSLTLCGIHSSLGLPPVSDSSALLLQHIDGLLNKLSDSSQLDASAKFSLLVTEFLIKQKIRFMQPTRFEEQLYYHLLHRTAEIKHKPLNATDLDKLILDNAFQRSVLLLPTALKYGTIDANVDYEKLALNYESFVNKGMPNSTESNNCMRDIVTLRHCKLSPLCLDLLTSDAPTFGYQRTHQVLLLYMLQHHKCAPRLSPMGVYQLLAKDYCTEVQREQNAIRSLGLPPTYRDLYLEQVTICGLNGFNEFMNWRNVVEVSSWFTGKAAQEDNRHINDLALVFYINALLLLH